VNVDNGFALLLKRAYWPRNAARQSYSYPAIQDFPPTCRFSTFRIWHPYAVAWQLFKRKFLAFHDFCQAKSLGHTRIWKIGNLHVSSVQGITVPRFPGLTVVLALCFFYSAVLVPNARYPHTYLARLSSFCGMRTSVTATTLNSLLVGQFLVQSFTQLLNLVLPTPRAL